jgi:hypothetical protein
VSKIDFCRLPLSHEYALVIRQLLMLHSSLVACTMYMQVGWLINPFKFHSWKFYRWSIIDCVFAVTRPADPLLFGADVLNFFTTLVWTAADFYRPPAQCRKSVAHMGNPLCSLAMKRPDLHIPTTNIYWMQSANSILVCMVLVRTQALFWGRRKKFKKNLPLPWFVKSKGRSPIIFFYVA